MIGLLLLAALVGALVLVLEITHRRHLRRSGQLAALPRGNVDRDRTVVELRIRAQSLDAQSTPSAGVPTSPKPRPVTQLARKVPAKASRAS